MAEYKEVVSLREGSFTCFGWSQVVVWGSVYCFCEGTLPVTCWAGDLYSLGCPLFLRAESIALSLSSLFNCSYKWTPLTLVFSYRFSRWMLISRLVNTLESDSKRHAVRSPRGLAGSRPWPFICFNWIHLPSFGLGFSLFCVRFGEASTKQTAGFFNLLGSVLLTGCRRPVCLESLFSVCRSWWRAVCLALCGGSSDGWIYGTFRRNATFSQLIQGASFFKSQNQHPASWVTLISHAVFVTWSSLVRFLRRHFRRSTHCDKRGVI